MIKDNNAIHVYGRMRNKLWLRWTNLRLFALIFSFTNGTDDHCFHGSAWYAAERCWVSRRTISEKFKELENLWLIKRKERIENWVKFIEYYAIDFDGSEKTSSGDTKNLRGEGSEKTSHNNRELKKEEKKKENTRENEEIDDLNSLVPADLEHPQAPVERNDPFWFYDLEDPYVQWLMEWKNFKKNNAETLRKLLKKGYTMETIQTVCNFVKQDEFWKDQIKSFNKLLDKNKEGVRYIDVMLSKIKQWKPKCVDLDALYWLNK